MVGQTIGPYRVVSRLGEGGMGEVYLVEDTRLGRRAALKLVSAEFTRDEARRERFVQEARLAAAIDHPHVASIYDVGEFDDRTYIVMEHVDGRSLREVLRAGPLPLTRALDRAIEAADALAKVHERGVIHRDLKPENLLIASDGYLKVIDFGLAKLAGPPVGGSNETTVADGRVHTADGVVLGTVGYMAPEQVRGEPADHRSDVFAFGAVLYEMVAGTAPFTRKSPAETMSAILTEAPPALEVDDAIAGAELQRIVRKCLVKDPGSRYQDMRDLVIDLRDLRSGSSGSGAGSRQAPAARAGGRLGRTPLLAGAALAVVAVLTLLVWALGPWRNGSSGAPDLPVRPAIAVVPFEVIGGDEDAAWLGKGLPSMLITGLAQTPDIELVGLERLGDAAREVGAASLDAVDRSRFAELARRAGAGFVLNGTVVRAGGDLRIDARVEDLESGAVRLAETVRGADALALADDLAALVRRGLDVQVAPGAVRPVADVSTASIEAYRAYLAGSEAEFNLRLGDARRMFEEAIALDPGFGMAYLRLSTVSYYAGQVSESERRLQEAATHLDRMPERDAMLVRAELERMEGRVDEAERQLEALLRRYPESEVGWGRLAFPMYARDPQRTLDVLERATAALPHSPGLLNLLGYAQLGAGQVDAALASFEGYVTLRPSEANTLDSLAEGQLVAGRPEDALATFQAALEGGYSGGRSGRALSFAVMGRYEDAFAQAPVPWNVEALLLSRVGRYREAGQALTALRRQYETNGWVEGVASVDLAAATLAFERGRCADALRDVAAAEALLSGRPASAAGPWLVYADLIAGVCDSRAGQHAEAVRRAEHARQVHRATAPIERWWLAALEGELALARGDYQTAARAWAAGSPAGKMFYARQVNFFMLSALANNLILRDGYARSAAVQGRTAEAIALYRALLSWGPDQPWTAVLEPRYVLALAKLLEQTGDHAAARAEYQRFLELWKDADQGLPELAEARRALGR